MSIITFAIYATAGVHICRKNKALQAAKDTMPTSKAVGITRSVTFNVTAGAAKVLSFERATPYSTCIESQHSQPGSGLSNRVSKNNAMWSYLRYSFIFFIAMVATWVRIYPSNLFPIYDPPSQAITNEAPSYHHLLIEFTV